MSDNYDVAGALSEVQSISQETGVSTESVSPSEPMFDLKWGNEVKQFPQSKVINYAQQGYDYNKKMSEFNNKRSAWEAEVAQRNADFKTREERYSYLDQIDRYAQENPAWLDTVKNAYNQALNSQQSFNNQSSDLESKLFGRIEALEGHINQQIEREKALKQKEDDAALDRAVSDYKKTNPSFDWESFDPVAGLTLEQKIINHAMDNGIQSFKAAANDYLFDELMKRAEGKAKEDLGKTIQKQSLLGLGPKTQQPTQGILGVSNVSNKSYSELVNEALSEIGA